MKVYNRARILTAKAFDLKMEYTHKRINSDIKKYTRKSPLDDDSFIKPSSTSGSEGSFQLILGEAFHLFLSDELPDEKHVTNHKISVLLDFINKSGYKSVLSSEFSKLGYTGFYHELLSGKYNFVNGNTSILSSIKSTESGVVSTDNAINTYNKILPLFSGYKTFTLRIKDSAGTTLLETKNSSYLNLLGSSSSVIGVPMNDSETNEKDGFNTGEDIHLTFYNTFYDIELNLQITGDPDIIAGNLKTIEITSIKLSNSDKDKYNPLANSK